MPTDTEICNLAIGNLGMGKSISDLTTDKSAEALACRIYYEISRDATQSDFLWPFCTKYASLSLVQTFDENMPPQEEWAYSYVYPADCLSFIRILSGMRNDTRQSRVPFEIVTATVGKLIFTDMQFAIGKYTTRVTDTTLFSASFVLALSWRLAAYIAPKITGGDPFKRQDFCLKMYQLEGTNAESSSIMENQDEELPDSEFIRARS